MKHDVKHVLVVDDEDKIREPVKLILELEGYVCHDARSGDAALQVLATRSVDLALVDVMMPGMTGLSLFEQMKERFPDVAVVFVTGLDDIDFAVKHLKEGAYDYLVKPVAGERLLQVVKDTLQKRRAVLDEAQHHRLMEEEAAHRIRQLEAREREVTALNRMVQVTLAEQFAAEEAAGGPADGHLPAPTYSTVSIMFTDLEGSTELLTRLGDEGAQELMGLHNVIVREQVADHGGREVKAMGDGFMIVFPSAGKAVSCAVDIQRKLRDFNQENDDRQLKVRIGINVGEPLRDREDFFGTAVTLAAKVMGLAAGGQILVSSLVPRLTGGASETWGSR